MSEKNTKYFCIFVGVILIVQKNKNTRLKHTTKPRRHTHSRFWLIDSQNISNISKMATDLYREAILVPMFSRFVVFSKRLQTNPQEASLRVFCVTDDKIEKTLEHQEFFEEIATSKTVEVLLFVFVFFCLFWCLFVCFCVCLFVLVFVCLFVCFGVCLF